MTDIATLRTLAIRETISRANEFGFNKIILLVGKKDTIQSMEYTSVIHEELLLWQRLKNLQIHTIHEPELVLAETKAKALAFSASYSFVIYYWLGMNA